MRGYLRAIWKARRLQPRSLMKKSTKKLALTTETIRRLDRLELGGIRGGVAGSGEDCWTKFACSFLACGTRIG